MKYRPRPLVHPPRLPTALEGWPGGWPKSRRSAITATWWWPFRDEAEVQLEAFRKRSEPRALLRKNSRLRSFISGIRVDEVGKPVMAMDSEEELFWSDLPGSNAKILESDTAVLSASGKALEEDEQYVRPEIDRA